MDNNTHINTSYNPDDEIDFRQLFQLIWQGKWIVVAIVSFFSISAVIYSLSLPNIYQSKALLSPVSEQAPMEE